MESYVSVNTYMSDVNGVSSEGRVWVVSGPTPNPNISTSCMSASERTPAVPFREPFTGHPVIPTGTPSSLGHRSHSVNAQLQRATARGGASIQGQTMRVPRRAGPWHSGTESSRSDAYRSAPRVPASSSGVNHHCVPHPDQRPAERTLAACQCRADN